MNLYSIPTGLFKLDGGAMFGVIPKSMWQKMNPADENNLCTWTMRCLLVEHDDRLILIDTGLGDKQSEKFFSYVQPHGDDSLKGSIEGHGFSMDDVTDVILTHFHFDHVGGAVSKSKDGNLYPTFKNAVYWSHSAHWKWAMEPNMREKASFLKENFVPLKENDQVQFIDKSNFGMDEIDFFVSNGHTEAQIIPIIQHKDSAVVYCADLIPSSWHVPPHYIMAYDIHPLDKISEKATMLEQAYKNNWTLFFEHDPLTECCNLVKTEKGIRVGEGFPLTNLI